MKNEDCAKTIGRIKTKFLHSVPLMCEKILSNFRNDHVTLCPLVAVFRKMCKNNMCSHECYSWAAHNKPYIYLDQYIYCKNRTSLLRVHSNFNEVHYTQYQKLYIMKFLITCTLHRFIIMNKSLNKLKIRISVQNQSSCTICRNKL